MELVIRPRRDPQAKEKRDQASPLVRGVLVHLNDEIGRFSIMDSLESRVFARMLSSYPIEEQVFG